MQKLLLFFFFFFKGSDPEVESIMVLLLIKNLVLSHLDSSDQACLTSALKAIFGVTFKIPVIAALYRLCTKDISYQTKTDLLLMRILFYFLFFVFVFAVAICFPGAEKL